MGFNREWFDELRKLSEESLTVIVPKSYRPTVDELVAHNLVSQRFLNTTLDLVKALNTKKYQFSPLFKVYPQHLVNFPPGKAFRKQWNIGFWAGGDPSDDFARIGIGFYLNKELGQKGIDEYTDYLLGITLAPEKFDNTFQQLGNYVEPIELSTESSLSKAILSDQPDFKDDWRFYGKCLRYNSMSDRAILSSMDLFVEEVINVFDIIKTNGFA